MKFSITLVAAVVAHTAAGAAVSSNGALSSQEIVETLLENPHLLPPNGKKGALNYLKVSSHH
jgi:hypothetical protein